MEIFTNEKTEQMFLNQIREQLSAFEFSGKDIRGGKVLAGFHRSGSTYEKWIKFKKKMSW